MKSSKWNLLWIIPEILCAAAVVASGVVFISKVTDVRGFDFLSWVFVIALGLIIIKEGFVFIVSGMGELRRCFEDE